MKPTRYQTYRYRNPWFDPRRRCSAEFHTEIYEVRARQVGEHRGVKILKVWANRFDWVLGDCAISQRAGYRAAHGHEAIDALLDGLSPCAPAVAQVLEAAGFTPWPYTEPSAKTPEERARRAA